jgi:hypothetical protein
MSLSYTVPSSLEYFACLVQSDEHFPLLEAAASIAQDEYPELDVQQVLADVDQLQARIRRAWPAMPRRCSGCTCSTSSFIPTWALRATSTTTTTPTTAT